ncbi:protelomerase family protein [uncultured Tateyamaria sp.]|uniref:protelomerase family protein n=1 Tax=uncultured Tateyamaria sp. TaxID=455651 RepID=UPI002626ACDC|nr:protelomerase family protein [uncultured Tateyamaria sp.]
MPRYPLTNKINEFTEQVVEMVGQQGWQGRLTVAWNAKREEFSDKTLGSQKLYIVRFRGAITERFEGLDQEDERRGSLERVLKIITFPEGMTETLNKEYTKSVKEKAENLVLCSNPEEIVAAYVEWLESTDVRQKALGVMGLTGRRFIEVLRDGEFAAVLQDNPNSPKVRVRHKYVLDFTGQAKTREAEGTMHGVTYRIPTIPNGRQDTAPLVLKAMAEIQESKEGQRWKQYDYRDLNSGESGRFNGQLRGSLANVDGITKEFLDVVSVKWLRSLYAELAYARFAPKRRTKSAFFAQILGHADDDLKTSLSYMVLALGDDQEEHEKARTEVQRLLDAVKKKAAEERAAKRVGDAIVIEDDDGDAVIDSKDMG